MIRAHAGETRTVTLHDLTGPSGAVTAGATVVMTLLDGSGAVVVGPLTATATGDDWSVTMTLPLLTGAYTLRATATVGSDFEIWEDALLVLATPEVGAVTRLDLVRRLARHLGDLWEVTATTPSTGPTTVQDTIRLPGGGGGYAGREAWVWAGTAANLELSRYVAGYDPTTKTLTLSPALPANPTTGDGLLLVNERGVGWTMAEYHGAIDDCIQDAGRMGGLPMVVPMPVWTTAAPTIAVPAGVLGVRALEYQDSEGSWRTVPPARRGGLAGVSVRGEEGVLELRGGWANLVPMAVRLRGYGVPGPLLSDADTTTVNPAWLIPAAAARLLLATLDRDPNRDRRAMIELRRADALLAAAVPLPAPSTDWLG